jgi:hypothetical protein
MEGNSSGCQAHSYAVYEGMQTLGSRHHHHFSFEHLPRQMSASSVILYILRARD